MRSTVDLSLELSACSATLSLNGVVSEPDAVAASRLCLALPRTIRVLRVDVRNVIQLEASARGVVKSLLAEWGRARQSRVSILVEQHTVDVLGDRDASPQERRPATPRHGDDQSALNGVFL